MKYRLTEEGRQARAQARRDKRDYDRGMATRDEPVGHVTPDEHMSKDDGPRTATVTIKGKAKKPKLVRRGGRRARKVAKRELRRGR